MHWIATDNKSSKLHNSDVLQFDFSTIQFNPHFSLPKRGHCYKILVRKKVPITMTRGIYVKLCRELLGWESNPPSSPPPSIIAVSVVIYMPVKSHFPSLGKLASLPPPISLLALHLLWLLPWCPGRTKHRSRGGVEAVHAAISRLSPQWAHQPPPPKGRWLRLWLLLVGGFHLQHHQPKEGGEQLLVCRSNLSKRENGFSLPIPRLSTFSLGLDMVSMSNEDALVFCYGCLLLMIFLIWQR